MQLMLPLSFSVYINGLALFCTSVQTVLFGHWILLLFQIRISCTVQYLVYENSLTAHWKSICKVKLVLLQEVKEPVLRRIGGARGVGGANLKKKISFSSFCCDTKKISYLCKIFRRKNFYGKQDTELSWVTKQFFRYLNSNLQKAKVNSIRNKDDIVMMLLYYELSGTLL